MVAVPGVPLLRVVGPGFVCGMVFLGGRVHRVAPRLGFMRGWEADSVLVYALSRGWDLQVL